MLRHTTFLRHLPVAPVRYLPAFTAFVSRDQSMPLLSLLMSFPSHFLQDMAWKHVLRKWQPWLQDIGLKSSTSAGSICREQRGGGEPGPSQAELKGAEWNQVEQGGTVQSSCHMELNQWSSVIWKNPGITAQTIQLLGICPS